MNEPFRILSLGAGMQSSALYLMAVHGDIAPAPEAAVFADPQWEPRATYAWLDELERIGGATIPIHRATIGSLRADIVDGAERGSRIANAPFFVMGTDGRGAMLRRTCTKEYKLVPIRRTVRRLFEAWRAAAGVTGSPRPGAVEQWIGISVDEAGRMRDSDVRYITNRYPLIERNMTRRDCEDWLVSHGYVPPPKSACIGCPYHDDAYWAAMKADSPDEWEDACSFDEAIRTGLRGVNGTRGMRKGGEAYLHRSLEPLRLVQLKPKPKAERWNQLDMFQSDCTGLCGV